MKSKHLIIVSLLLAVVAMGAVSASQDIATDEVLATDNITEDPIEESSVDEVIGQSNDADALELEPSDFNTRIKDLVDLEDENDKVVVNYTVPQDANGKVDVYVDYLDAPVFSKKAVSGQSINITTDNLNITDPGEYHIMVNYVPNSGDTLTLAQNTLKAHVYTEDDFGIWYDALIASKKENVISHFSYPLVGTLILSVNGTPRYTKDLNEINEVIYVGLSDLNITSDSTYTISARYVIGTTSKEIDLGNATIEVYGVDWEDDDFISVISSADILNPEDYFIEINNNWEYINGTVSIYIDGTLKLTKDIREKDKTKFVDFTVADLGIYNNIALGNHTVKVIFMKDKTKKHELEKSVDFYALPALNKNFVVSVGEKDALKVTYIKGFSGTATLYNSIRVESESDPGYYYWTKGSLYKSVNFVDGIATIPFDSMAKGEHVFILNITGYDHERHVKVIVKTNTRGFSASASASEITVGDSVVVKLTGQRSNGRVYIYLDNEEYKSIPLTNGYILETFTGLSVGTHRIKVYFDDGIHFYSNTFHVTVKKAPTPAKKANKITLTLKKVKVKKSAKKLVLQATLKINGKKVKGKVVKFKFKGKTYKAKTNKKGVAKVTIKKKVLKKLKVGKKVKYQAIYSKVTKKYTVKVKK